MIEIFTQSLSVVEPPVTGVHLMWSGPLEFLFAPGGWRIERRDSIGTVHVKSTCDVVNASQLKGVDELPLHLGTMIVAPGIWPGPEGGPCTICTLELSSSEGGIHGSITGTRAFLYGLRNGKATMVAGPLTGIFDFGAAPMDKLIIYLQTSVGGAAAPLLRICRYEYGSDDWSNAKLLATLQLPIRELMPALANPNLEYAEAKRRLLPGDAIDPARFGDFMNLLRGLASSSPRPIQDTLLVRASADDQFDEMCVLDPLRMVYSSPIWRRALGLSYFDADPALVVNHSYDYRITGLFPASSSTFYGFHTIPSGAALPCDFYLHDCHFRLPAPTVVQTAPSIAQTGLMVRTRRGIRLQPQPNIPWIDGLLEQNSVVIDLPSPATSIELDLDAGHQLTIQGGVPWGSFSPPITVPAGAAPVIAFPQPASQLRISGSGFLFGVRLNGLSGSGFTSVPVLVSPVLLANTPRPAAPLSARAQSLQAGAQITTLVRPIPPNLPLGMDVFWEPALASGVTFWPSPAQAPPPLEATSFQVERQTGGSGVWEAVIGGDNLALGGRSAGAPDTTVRPGVDMMQIYPESRVPPSTSTQFSYRDTFLAPVASAGLGNAKPKPPAPGTMVQYRVRALDAVGRPSATWTQTDPARLEKHEPPPLPSAPDETPADQLPSAAPTGVYARVLVRGAEGLTPEETSLLGSSDNAIVLHWGWHPQQRKLDPFARQFRLYLAPPVDEVPGTLVSATADPNLPGVYRVTLTLQRSVRADAAQSQYLDAGYPFFIQTHTGGTSIQATLRTVVPVPGGGFRTPATGPVTLHLKYSSNLTRATGWSERIKPAPNHAFIPITAQERYQAVIRNRLNLSEAHPRDTLWVGVTAADDQPYVVDSFTGINPGGPLPGNESAVAAALCQGKRMVRPSYQPPPPAAAAQRILAPEPANGPIVFQLDLAPYLVGSGIGSGQMVIHERLHASDLLAALDIQQGQVLALPVNARASETSQALSISNPNDQSELVASLTSGDFERVEDRLLVLLAQLHPFRDRLFQPLTHDPVNTLSFQEQLPSSAARYVYRVRLANGVGQFSAEGAIPHAIVRVPSTTPGPRPLKDLPRADDPAQSLRFRVPAHPRLKHVLIFRTVVTDENADPAALLLRVPNRPDLPPGGNFRLRLSNGARLAPTVLALATLQQDSAGWRLLVEPESPGAGPVRVWIASLTVDGAPSDLWGPSQIPFTPPPPQPPVLSAVLVAAAIRFNWTWPPGRKYPLTLERSLDGSSWQRISPPLATTTTSLKIPSFGTPRRYRLAMRTGADPARASNVVVI